MVMSLKLPSTMRACKNEVCKGAAQATPSTERTRPSSVSRIGLASLACSTIGSLTQTCARMLTTGVYVQLMIPKNTDVCCAIKSAEKANPQRSIANLAVSPKSILRASLSIFYYECNPRLIRSTRARFPSSQTIYYYCATGATGTLWPGKLIFQNSPLRKSGPH